MTKVLLTNSIGPYEKGWGEDMFDLFSARLTRGQGPFSLSSTFNALALHLIAENLKAPVSVLEWPTERALARELLKGYDYVGIQVFTIHIPRIARMVRLIKKIAPDARIVLGGYGVAALYNPPPNDPENLAGYLLDNAFAVCRDEGVRFFRRLLGEDPDAPIRQLSVPLADNRLARMGETAAAFPVSSTLVSLGCPNGCEFCNTSAFFGYRKIRVAEPEDVLASIKSALARVPRGGPPLFHMLWDEDLLEDPSFVRRLGELLFREGLLSRVVLSSFASMRSLSRISAEELAACGVGSLWIGVESKFEETITSVHRFEKRRGADIAATFADLRRFGITVIASNIIGLDFHTRENLLEDLEYFVSLRPDMYQVAPLNPCPGTRLFERIQEEERLSESYGFNNVKIWTSGSFRHPNLDEEDIQRAFDLLHQKLYLKNGPSVLSLLDAQLAGLRTAMHHRDPRMGQRARTYFLQARQSAALFAALRSLSPSPDVSARVDSVEKKYHRLVGPFTGRDRFMQGVVLRKLSHGAEEAGRDKPVERPYVLFQYPGNGGPGRVAARGNPWRSMARAGARSLMRSFLRLPEPDFAPLSLWDMDRFDVRPKTVEIEGDLLSYADEGEGPAVLLLHGNPTWSFLYRHLIHDLRKDHRVIAPDFLGYGLSDKPQDGDYRMEAHIRRLSAFIEKLSLSGITLVCQDWGGIIGLSYASRNKERFAGLVPMNTAAFGPQALSELSRCGSPWAFGWLWSFKTPYLGDKMALDWNLFLRAALSLGMENRGTRLTGRVLRGYLYPFQRKQDRTAILASVRQVPMTPFSPVAKLLRKTEKAIAGWDVPARMVWGMRDPVFGPWFLERFEELLPNHGRSVRVETGGHFLPEDEPDAVVAAVREFLKKNVRPRRRRTRTG
ncbi:MAG: alpha/beta fold hydrolase [Thermodesulfobacteriota bacterium]